MGDGGRWIGTHRRTAPLNPPRRDYPGQAVAAWIPPIADGRTCLWVARDSHRQVLGQLATKPIDGAVGGWGQNGSGQLGDGTKRNRHAPTRIGHSARWVKISAGRRHA